MTTPLRLAFSLPFLPLMLLALFFVLVFGGYSLAWSGFPYDEWRLLELSGLSIVAALSLFCCRKVWFERYSIWRCTALFNLIAVLYVAFSPVPLNAKTMLCIYALLLVMLAGLSQYLHSLKNPMLTTNWLFALCATPLLTVIWLPIETFIVRMQPELIRTTGAWAGAFLNIRQYDDVVLPLVCLLFGLALGKRLEILRVLIGVLVLWGCVAHGARAVLLSLVVGVVLTIIVQRKIRWALPLLLSLFAAWACTLLALSNYVLARTGDSHRWAQYRQAWDTFLSHPFTGALTQNFYSQARVNHPHNMLLQWLSDYGITGLILSLILFAALLPILRHGKTITPMALAGTIAVICNAMLSGSMVYPHSQIAVIVFLAWALSQTPDIVQPLRYANSLLWLYRIATLLLIATLLMMQLPNLSRHHSTSEPEPNSNTLPDGAAPYLWHFGKSEYLRDHD